MYRILIIDDEPWSRKVVLQLGAWNELNLEVVGEAEDGNHGLELIKGLKPDIVITDMKMPGINGIELLKNVKELYPDIKLIVMSGYDDFEYLRQAIRSRAMEYLLKPIDPDELNAVLRQCIRELVERDSRVDLATMLTDAKGQNLLEEYLALRRQIKWHMVEMNRPMLLRLFETLTEFLNSHFGDNGNAYLKQQLKRDLLLLINEGISEFQMEGKGLDEASQHDLVKEGDGSTIQEMIQRIYMAISSILDTVEAYRKNRSRMDVQEIQLFIDRNFSEQISLESIAQQFFISKEHLSRIFKAYAGENMTDYILRKRMERARKLILEDGASIRDAAELSGYSDIPYFYRVFKKHFGITPGELRK